MSIRLTAIVAMTPERVIGRAGTLPWHLPEDLAFFKRTTSGHPIVMGRKTYESIGRPLPKRRNIVLTRDETWASEGVEVIHRPDDLDTLPGLAGQVFIIGGSEIYAAFLPVLDDLLVSHIFENHDGDTRLPEFEAEFPQSEILETHSAFEVRRHFKPDRTEVLHSISKRHLASGDGVDHGEHTRPRVFHVAPSQHGRLA